MSIIVLNATTKSIEALLEGAVATNQPEFSAHYADVTSTAFTEGENDGVLNNTTAVSLVAAPAASTRRIVKEIVIYNADTAAVTVTIRINNNSNYRRIQKVTLAAGATWKLSDGGVSTSSGSGDVVGPASATDGHLVVFDGATGKLVKDGGSVPAGGGGGVISGPNSFMDNGVINVTVASNNLTVAVKTITGADPSAGDPVKIRIGNVYRSITSALSITKNAGTNWFNAGSAELATKEIDYFVYLGFNSIDGVTIGFSRIPFGSIYSDFSATTTNEKYCAISTITNAAAGDEYVNIGRFAATLSAGAGYTWSVPTFTPSNLIQRPINESRILVWTPVYTGFSSNPSQTAVYKIVGDKVEYAVSSASAGTSSLTTYTMTFPFKAKYLTYLICPDQSDNDIHGNGFVQIVAGSATGSLLRSGLVAWTNSGIKYAEIFGICYI